MGEAAGAEPPTAGMLLLMLSWLTVGDWTSMDRLAARSPEPEGLQGKGGQEGRASGTPCAGAAQANAGAPCVRPRHMAAAIRATCSWLTCPCLPPPAASAWPAGGAKPTAAFVAAQSAHGTAERSPMQALQPTEGRLHHLKPSQKTHLHVRQHKEAFHQRLHLGRRGRQHLRAGGARGGVAVGGPSRHWLALCWAVFWSCK